MKTFSLLRFLFLGALLASARLLAITSVPYTEGVSFSCKMSGTGTGTLSVYGEGTATITHTTSGTTTESSVGVAWLRPGKKYPVNFQANGPTEFWLSFTAPNGYELLVDDLPINLTYQSTGGVWSSYDYTLELRPVARGGEAAAGVFSGIQLGKSVTWDVGLGGLRSGRGAGLISFKEYDLTNNPANRQRLFYSAPSNYVQITAIYDSGPTLRQVMTPQALVDVVDLTGNPNDGYTLKFYLPSQGSWNGTNYTVSGSPWRTIKVEQPVSTQLKITETEGAVSRLSLLTLTSGSISSGAYVWTLQEGDATNCARTTIHTSTIPTSGQRDDGVTVNTTAGTYASPSNSVVAKTKYHYETKAWGEELINVIADPDTAALTTTYDYHTTSGDYGNYRKLKSVTEPTGNWVGYIYYDLWDYRGQLLYELHPYKDSPSTPTFNTAICRVFAYDYAPDWTGRRRIPSLRYEYHGSTIASEHVITPTLNQTILGQYYTINQADAYVDASTYLRTVSEVMDFRYGNNPDYNGLVWSVKRPDSSQDSYAHYQGSYNYSTKAFTFGGGSAADCHFRTIVWHGSTDSTGATGYNGYDGVPFTLVYLIPNKSTMDVTIRNNAGLVVRTESHVYTGGSSFSPLTSEDFTYDSAGRLTTREANLGATPTTTLINTITNGQLVSTVGADGTESQFTYDLIGRTATSRKKGAAASGSSALQGDITNTYDGAGHVTQTVTSGGSLSLTATAVYDFAGRTTSSTAPGGYTTGYDYTLGPCKTKVTFPGGAEQITETYIDGQPKSVSGSAVVAQDIDFTVNSTSGFITRLVELGGSANAWVKTTTDWLGRQIEEVRPGWNGGSDVTRSWSYNSSGQLSKFSQPGRADTLYVYDTFGRLSREGLDLGGTSGALDLGGGDRITDHEYVFWTGGGTWWLQTATRTYATTGSGSFTTLEWTDEQLSGFAGGIQKRRYLHDVFGNLTHQYTIVDASNKTVTTTTDTPESAIDAQQIAHNGLLVSARNTTGITLTYGYDALGRQETSVDPRTKGTGPVPRATSTAYLNGTNQVDTVTDPAGIVQATYAYDGAGRVKSVKNALNEFAYYAYTDLNKKKREWGATTTPVEYDYDNWGRQTTMKTYRGGTGWSDSVWPGETGSVSGTSPGTADYTLWVYDEPTGLLKEKYDAANLALVSGVLTPVSGAKKISYTYTQAGQIKTRTWARGSATTYSYFGEGSGEPVTGELRKVDYADTSMTDLEYTYNRLGNQATVTDVTGTRTFNYNVAGTLELQNEILGTSSSDFYGDHRITRGYASSGVVGRYNRLSIGTAANAYAEYDVPYAYDATTGRLNKVFDFNYTYASDSNLIATITQDSSSWNQARSYLSTRDQIDVIDTRWNTTSKARFGYAYDNLGRITQVAKTGNSTDGLFNRYGNGTEGLTTYYGYDARSQLTSEVTKVGTGSTPLPGRNDSGTGNDGYAYDNLGNRTALKHNSASVTGNYSVNELNQYTSRDVPGSFDVAGSAPGSVVTVTRSGGATDTAARSGSYFFDAYALTNTVNPVFATLTITDNTTPTPNTDSLPAFVARTAEPFTYDDDGNLLSDGRWTYTYDAENRLLTAETPNSASVSAGVTRQKLTFAYDYLGRRVSKLVQSGWNGSSYTLTDSSLRFLYDGWNLLWEYDASASLAAVRVHVWGLDQSGTMNGAGGVGGLLFTWNLAQSVYYHPVFDAMGNNHGSMDSSTGNLIAAYEYDAFGQTLRESGTSAAGNPFRFATKYADLETGLVQYNTRYYSPSLGRFINRDTISEQGGLNLYGYCGNNGVNHWDYLGNISQDYYLNNDASDPSKWLRDGITFDDGHVTIVNDIMSSIGNSVDAATNRGVNRAFANALFTAAIDNISKTSAGFGINTVIEGAGGSDFSASISINTGGGSDSAYSLSASTSGGALGGSSTQPAASNGETSPDGILHLPTFTVHASSSGPAGGAASASYLPMVQFGVDATGVVADTIERTSDSAQLAARQFAQGGARPSFRRVNVAQLRAMAQRGSRYAGYFKTLGQFAAKWAPRINALGAAIGVYDFQAGVRTGNVDRRDNGLINAALGTYGALGGPLGWAASGSYFGGGLIDNAFGTSDAVAALVIEYQARH